MKTIYQDLSKYHHFYLVILLLAGLMTLTLHSLRRGADELDYLRWTHSFLFDQDLYLLNNFEAVGGSYRLTPTGYIFERVNIGGPLMWLPFYGAAALPTPNAVDRSWPGDHPVQLLWINFSSWLYLSLAGILTVAALRRLFSGWVLAVAVLGIFLGTPVPYYVLLHPTNVHLPAIFLAALLLYLWISGPAGQTQQGAHLYLMLGLVIGWLMLVASYNIVFFLLPGFSLVKELVEQRSWSAVWPKCLALGLGGVIGFLPQMIGWWFLFGSPFYSPYSGQLLWSEPYMLETLFSTFHGLFFYAPVLLLVIPGLWWLGRRSGWAALSLGSTWLALAYIVSINVAWWAGSSFGNRYFLTLAPFFVLGLAAFLQASKRWGLVLTILAVLWTVGLYLQFLSGVRLTSDSTIYSAMELAQGQLTAFGDSLAILPQLWVEWPWFSVPAIMLPLFSLILVGVSRIVYGWTMPAESCNSAPNGRALRFKFEITLIAVGLALILFIGWAGLRGEQTKAALASQGFFNQPHEVVFREIKEVAGRAGLVTRAMYHEHMGQRDQAIADLRRASGLWKPDAAPHSSRLYLGPTRDEISNVPVSLHLDYPGNVRLIGYRILEAAPNLIQGELFWEKQAGKRSREVVTPIIRAFDRLGNNLGNVELESPFPAEYIPAGGLFKDTFTLRLNTPAEAWVWLAVNLAEDPNAPPLNAQGRAESGIIGSVNIGPVAPSPLISGENAQDFIGQAELLLGPTYQPGQMIPIQWVGQAQPRGSTASGLALSLLDSGGKVAAQKTYPLPSAREVANLPFSATYCFDLPATLAEDDYRLTIASQPPGAESRIVETKPLTIRQEVAQPDFASTICDLLEADFARRYEAPAPQNSVEASVANGQIRLLGYDLSIIPQADSVSARVMLHWRAQARVTHDYMVAVQLLDTAGDPVVAQTGVPNHGARPTSTWLKNEWVLDEHVLAVPPLPPGNFQLTVALIYQQSGLPAENDSGPAPLVLQTISIP